ncbi:MAG: UbiA family prenyltransferase [Armatimonadetes bacterium]|nr:UbiA family prenyltransferase [Armatimonadota bacterium]
MLYKKIKIILELIKFEHTIFALPFAYLGAILAKSGLPNLSEFLLITLAMAGARTAGMSLNRLIDHNLDAQNPRTKNRALPQGLLKRSSVWMLVLSSLSLLFYSSFRLNLLCFYLSPLAFLILFVYSYLKRFTWLTHLFLGMVLACAPIGGWIAITGKLSASPFILSLGVIFWVAGFDIIYAMLDLEFDKKIGLHSIPARFGVKKSLNISSLFHFITVSLLLILGKLLNLGIFYFLGVLVISIFLIYEHLIISPSDLRKVNQAFFNLNGIISITLLIFTIINFI